MRCIRACSCLGSVQGWVTLFSQQCHHEVVFKSLGMSVIAIAGNTDRLNDLYKLMSYLLRESEPSIAFMFIALSVFLVSMMQLLRKYQTLMYNHITPSYNAQSKFILKECGELENKL